MTRAICVALGDRESAIGEVVLCWVAERPTALNLADLQKPDPSHLADFGLAIHPSVRPHRLAGDCWETASRPEKPPASKIRPPTFASLIAARLRFAADAFAPKGSRAAATSVTPHHRP